MDTAVIIEIEKLRTASLAQLRLKFRDLFQEPTRCRHRQHLFRRIAWRLQALAQGDLSQRARHQALAIARDADLRWVPPQDFLLRDDEPIQPAPTSRHPRRSDPRLPLPGVVLSRQWKGQTILVEVLADGFRYQDRHYSSLSAIASAITGTRWNGLAFFGLTRPKEPARAPK